MTLRCFLAFIFTLPSGGSDAQRPGRVGEEFRRRVGVDRRSPSPLVPRDPPEGRVKMDVRTTDNQISTTDHPS